MKLSIEQPLLDSRVSIHAPVAQEWAMRTMLVHAIPLHIGEHNLFAIDRPLGNDFAARRRNKALPPNLNSLATCGRFMPDAVRSRDVTTIGNRVTALNRFPGRILSRAKFLFFRRMPADGCWVKNHFRSPQCGESCRFRIPLVPANADANLSLRGRPRLKSEIARREIKFLVIKRIVGNMHLAIFAEQVPVAVDDYRGVVIQARAALLEQRCNDYNAKLARDFTQCRCRSSGNLFGQVEVFVLFRLAKILRPEELRQTNDLRAFLSLVANEFTRAFKILFRLRAAPHLNEPDLCHLRLHHSGINHEGHEDVNHLPLVAFVIFVVKNYWTESAGTILMLSITTRLVGLLISPALFLDGGVSPILSSTSSPLFSFPNVLYL